MNWSTIVLEKKLSSSERIVHLILLCASTFFCKGRYREESRKASSLDVLPPFFCLFVIVHFGGEPRKLCERQGRNTKKNIWFWQMWEREKQGRWEGFRWNNKMGDGVYEVEKCKKLM